jgi:very-short-patch-repair endonuclease
MKYCDEIDAHDNHPPYRDEQRAFYDSIRDIEAFRNGWTLLRIKDRDIDWETASIETLNNIL